MRKLRILHIIQKIQNRGAETFACQLSNHLLSLGHDIKVVALFKGEANLPFNGIIDILDASSQNRFFDYSAWKRLSNIIDSFQPDIVQANAGDTLKYTVFSKRIFGWDAPIISRNASEIGRYLKTPIQKKINSFFYKNVNHVVSVSRASEKDIIYHFPFLSGKTQVIPVGLEIISKTQNIILSPEDAEHIIHVGGFTFEKNHLGLLRIFQATLKKNRNLHLHLVGDGPLKAEIEGVVHKMNLTQNITFYGFVNNPLAYIKAADVLVLPSIIEGLPGVLLEGMLCKIPVVAYNVGGISEIVTSQTGILIQKNDEEAFMKAVLQTIEMLDINQIETAHKMVVEDYMNDEIALKFVKVYKTLIAY